MNFSDFYTFWLVVMGVIALVFVYIAYDASKKATRTSKRHK